jgi:hypothetical protein
MVEVVSQMTVVTVAYYFYHTVTTIIWLTTSTIL